MRVTGLSRLVESYARKSCRAFPLEDKDMYMHAKSDVAMLESPQHARRQGRSNAIETGTPKAAVLQ